MKADFENIIIGPVGTEENDKIIRECLADMGFKWGNGDSLKEKSLYEDYKQDAFYIADKAGVFYGNSDVINGELNIISADEFIITYSPEHRQHAAKGTIYFEASNGVKHSLGFIAPFELVAHLTEILTSWEKHYKCTVFEMKYLQREIERLKAL